MRHVALMAVAASALVAAGIERSFAAEEYPVRPIRFIVPFPPGGSNDIMARLTGVHLTERLGKSVIIDNRAGAASIVGMDIAAKASPDGHTIVIVSARDSRSARRRARGGSSSRRAINGSPQLRAHR